MRRKIVAGNWKMNNDQNESNILIHSVIKQNSENSSCNIYVSPSFPFLKDAVLTCSKSNIKVLSQNVSHLTNGALTGDVSCTMLKSIGINSVIIGSVLVISFAFIMINIFVDYIYKYLDPRIT